MSRGKHPKQAIDFGKFKSLTAFHRKESSIYQALAFGLVETLIRLKNDDGQTKKFFKKLKNDLEELKESTSGNLKNQSAILTFAQIVYTVKNQTDSQTRFLFVRFLCSTRS